ncbi:MAG: phytase, partial [Cruoricaptor ignavus]|nr:phytase [Cruoricaptor ignavus]
MKFNKNIILSSLAIAAISSCSVIEKYQDPYRGQRIKPTLVTEKTNHDTDDPAIWLHPTDFSKSLIIGTDKNSEGGLFVFDLEGNIVNKILDLKRPNNVDIAYGLP